jgi:16S rRNA (cytosine967-C5)-methyltransferase
MPPQRFALPSEAPGLAARRIAADILDGVLHKHRTLDEQLDGAAAHPGLKSLSDRDRALMRRLVFHGCLIVGFQPTPPAPKVRF